MLKVAIYVIPTGDFYNDGSKIVGFDIKNSKILSKKPLNQYGFHLTLTDVATIKNNNLYKFINRIEKITSLPYFQEIYLKPKSIESMPNANVIAIKFYWSWKLFFLHTLLTIFVQPLSEKTKYTHNLNKLGCYKKIKTILFKSPYVFDDFLPHMTIANKNKVNEYLTDQFKKYINKNIKIRTVYLVEKNKSSDFFKIKKSFYLGR